MKSIKRRMHDFVYSRGAYWGIGAVSFCEALFLPVPLEAVLIPFMIANRDKVWRIAAVVTVACLLGGLVGYAIGFYGFQTIGRPLIESLGYSEQFEAFENTFNAHGFWAILGVDVSPVPFQVAMLGAGFAKYAVWRFLLATAIARGIRYFGMGLLVCVWGRPAGRGLLEAEQDGDQHRGGPDRLELLGAGDVRVWREMIVSQAVTAERCFNRSIAASLQSGRAAITYSERVQFHPTQLPVTALPAATVPLKCA